MHISDHIQSASKRVALQIISKAPFAKRELEYRLRRKEINQRREVEWRERVKRSGEVPIAQVTVGRSDFLIAPVSPGKRPDTLRVRIFMKGEYPRDMGRRVVSISPREYRESGSPEDLWARLSAHQRMSMISAVFDRTPQGGPRA